MARHPLFWIAFSAALWVATPARSELEAHLYVWSLSEIGRVNTTDADGEPPEEGPTSAEPFWLVAIRDAKSSSAWVDPICAVWTATTTLSVDAEFSRVIPDLSEATFHIAVFDYDLYPTFPDPFFPQYYSELLGDHEWVGARDVSPPALPEPNNNTAPSYQAPDGLACNDPPIGLGFVGNWEANFRSWYTDTTPPSAATTPIHDGPDEALNDDDTLSFTWTPGTDANSGVRQVIVLERQSDGAYCEIALADPTESRFDLVSVHVCDAGGPIPALELDTDESYRAQIRTRNGVTPSIDAPQWADSGFSGWVLQQPGQVAIPLLSPWGRMLLVLGLAGAGAITRLRSRQRSSHF